MLCLLLGCGDLLVSQGPTVVSDVYADCNEGSM